MLAHVLFVDSNICLHLQIQEENGKSYAHFIERTPALYVRGCVAADCVMFQIGNKEIP